MYVFGKGISPRCPSGLGNMSGPNDWELFFRLNQTNIKDICDIICLEIPPIVLMLPKLLGSAFFVSQK